MLSGPIEKEEPGTSAFIPPVFHRVPQFNGDGRFVGYEVVPAGLPDSKTALKAQGKSGTSFQVPAIASGRTNHAVEDIA